MIPANRLYRNADSTLDMEAHACYPSTWEAVADESGMEDHPWLHRENEAYLDYMTDTLSQNFLNK